MKMLAKKIKPSLIAFLIFVFSLSISSPALADKGISVRTGTSDGENLFYGYSLDSTSGDFLKFQNTAGINKFRIDLGGGFHASGTSELDGNLCWKGVCKTDWSQVGGTSQWTTSGSNIYYNTGNVSIGTTGSGAKLDIINNVAYFASTLAETIGSSPFRVQPRNQANSIFTITTDGLASNMGWQAVSNDGVTAKNLVLNPYGGYAGIGISAPSTPLHVNATDGGVTANLITLGLGGAGSATNIVSRFSTMGGAGNNRQHVLSTNYNWVAGARDVTTYGSAAISFAPGSDNISNGLEFLTGQTTDTSPSVKMFLAQNGNVGIGATAPQVLLTVQKAESDTVGSGGGLGYQASNGGIWHSQRMNTGHDLVWDVYNGLSWVTGLVQTNDGYVGIGTTNPQFALHIGANSMAAPFVGGAGAVIATGANTRLNVQGSSDAALSLIDTGAGANKQMMQLIADGGITYFRSITDAGGMQANNILALDHTLGKVGIGTNAPDTLTHIVGNFDNSSNKASSDSNKGLTITSSAAGSANYARGNEFGIVFATNGGGATDYPGAGIMAIPVAAATYVGADLAFQTHNSAESTLLEKMRITSAGTVGIGTSNPSGVLEVRRDSAAPAVLGITNTQSVAGSDVELRLLGNLTSNTVGSDVQISFDTGSGGQDWGIGVDRSSGGVFNISGGANQGDGQYPLGNNVRFTINTLGLVGIGTHSPITKLHIEDTSDTQLMVKSTGANNYAMLKLKNAFGDTNIGINGIAGQILTGSAAGALAINNMTGQPIHISADTGQVASEGMTILEDGKVGIGTTNPNTILHIYKASDPYMTIQTGGGNYAYMQFQTPSSGSGYILKNTGTGNSLLDKSFYLWNDTGPIQFVPNGVGADAMSLIAGGNVGIGTASPGNRLEIYKSGDDSSFVGGLRINHSGKYVDFNICKNCMAGLKIYGNSNIFFGNNDNTQTVSFGGPVDMIPAPGANWANAWNDSNRIIIPTLDSTAFSSATPVPGAIVFNKTAGRIYIGVESADNSSASWASEYTPRLLNARGEEIRDFAFGLKETYGRARSYLKDYKPGDKLTFYASNVDPEVEFFDEMHINLRCYYGDKGMKIKKSYNLSADNKYYDKLAKADDDYLALQTGEKVLLKFEDSSPQDADGCSKTELELVSTGYYERRAE